MARMKGFKDPWAKMDQKLKEGMEGMADDDLKKKVSEAALYRSEQVALMKDDLDIKEKASSLNEAKRGYKEQIQGADLTIKYARQALGRQSSRVRATRSARFLRQPGRGPG
jgi:hypothetical protein